MGISAQVMELFDRSALFINQQMGRLDDFALRNVQHREDGKAAPKGGPFSAQNYLYNKRTKEWLQIGNFLANFVVKSGIASNHAEAMKLVAEEIGKISAALKKSWNLYDTYLIQISSAQSCPACYAKQIILHDWLVNQKILKFGHMAVIYGATYQETLNVAGFNDEPYNLSIVGRTINPRDKNLLLKIRDVDWNMVPAIVQKAFNIHASRLSNVDPKSFAVVYRRPGETFQTPDGVIELPERLVFGLDKRPKDVWGGDIHATPSVTAIRGKCIEDRNINGYFHESWATPGTVYTLTPTGVLRDAEAQWGSTANIAVIRNAPANILTIPLERESPLALNDQLYERLAAGYNHASVGIMVARAHNDNRAQAAWPPVIRELEGDGVNSHYDGIAARGRKLAQFGPICETRFGPTSVPLIRRCAC